MPSKREEVLSALLAVLSAIPGRTARRGGELPTSIPANGLLILRDGDPGEPEVTLSPPIYDYRHMAEVEAIMQLGATPAALDAMLVELGAAIAADPTLGGLCDWAEPQAPIPVEVPVEGGLGLLATVVPIALHYSTTGPLA